MLEMAMFHDLMISLTSFEDFFQLDFLGIDLTENIIPNVQVSNTHTGVMIQSVTYNMTSSLTSDYGTTNNFLSDASMNYV